MKHYIVCPSPDPERFAACVLALGPSAPLDEMDTIQEDLQKQGVVGRVVFDLLVANANRIRRYFTCYFDGEVFELSRFELIDGDEGMRQHSSQLLTRFFPVLDMIMMTPGQRFALSKGFVM